MTVTQEYYSNTVTGIILELSDTLTQEYSVELRGMSLLDQLGERVKLLRILYSLQN